MKKVKLFISHASEDKKDFVLPLTEALKKEFDIWIDKDSLIIGRSLLEQIDEGLRESDHGVVILSPDFFVKHWPQRELDGLLALEEKNKKAILPIWKDIDFEGIQEFSPILASLFAAKASDGIEKVVEDIRRAVDYFVRGKSVERREAGTDKLQAVLQKQAERRRSENKVSSTEGVHLGRYLADETINLLNEQIRPLRTSAWGLRIEGPREGAFGPMLTISRGGIYLHAEYQNDVVNSARSARLLLILGQNTGDVHLKLSEDRYSLFVDANDKAYWMTGDGKEVLATELLVDRWLSKLADKLDEA